MSKEIRSSRKAKGTTRKVAKAIRNLGSRAGKLKKPEVIIPLAAGVVAAIGSAYLGGDETQQTQQFVDQVAKLNPSVLGSLEEYFSLEPAAKVVKSLLYGGTSAAVAHVVVKGVQGDKERKAKGPSDFLEAKIPCDLLNNPKKYGKEIASPVNPNPTELSRAVKAAYKAGYNIRL